MADSNVTPFPNADGLPENPMQLAPRHPGFCTHPSILIDAHTRTIQCADLKCGAALDPFDFLRDQAATISRAWDNCRHVRQQATEASERVHALKKEEARLRAMVKRLQDKSGALVTFSAKKET